MTQPVDKKTVGKGKAGPGRPKGRRNNMTLEVREMILRALDEAGGVEYLRRKAEETPQAFLSLVGKVLPLQVTGAGGGPLQVQEVPWLRERRL